MRKVAVLALSPLLFACAGDEFGTGTAAQGDAIEAERKAGTSQFMTLRDAADQDGVTPRLEGGTLLLGKTRLEGWQSEVPKCEQCALTVAQRFKPDGPDTLLTLSHDGDPQWLFFDIRHIRAFVGDWSIRWSDENGVTVQSGEESRSLKAGEPVRLVGCELALHDVQSLIDTSPAGVSSESPRVRIQIKGICH